MILQKKSHLSGKRILVVDDEKDVLDAVEELLDMASIDKALDFDTASEKINQSTYDLAVLDIMGVNGLGLLEKTVKKGIPTAMLTAHAMNLEVFMASIQKGAIAFLPKEKLADLDRLLNDIMAAVESGKEPWQILFDKLADYFDEKFGPGWKAEHKEFWSEFNRLIKTRFATDR